MRMIRGAIGMGWAFLVIAVVFGVWLWIGGLLFQPMMRSIDHSRLRSLSWAFGIVAVIAWLVGPDLVWEAFKRGKSESPTNPRSL